LTETQLGLCEAYLLIQSVHDFFDALHLYLGLLLAVVCGLVRHVEGDLLHVASKDLEGEEDLVSIHKVVHVEGPGIEDQFQSVWVVEVEAEVNIDRVL